MKVPREDPGSSRLIMATCRTQTSNQHRKDFHKTVAEKDRFTDPRDICCTVHTQLQSNTTFNNNSTSELHAQLLTQHSRKVTDQQIGEVSKPDTKLNFNLTLPNFHPQFPVDKQSCFRMTKKKRKQACKNCIQGEGTYGIFA